MQYFTVITINKNNAAGLKETLSSIKMQRSQDYELICVDGHSSDQSRKVIEDFRHSISHFLLDSGSGVYAAMNQAVEAAHGEWVIFLNSGDCFFSSTVLSDFCPEEQSHLAYGRAWLKNTSCPARYNGLQYIWKGQPFCHQALFTRLDVLRARPFDTALRIAADYKFIVGAYLDGLVFEDLEQDICRIEPPGISGRQVLLRLREKYQVARHAFPDKPTLLVTIRQALREYRNLIWR